MGDPEVRPLTQNVNRLEDDTGACHSRRRCVPSGRAHRETGHAIGPIVPSVVRAPAVCGAARMSAPLHRARVFRAGEFPSGQRGQTVNLMAQPSQVRILLPPPASLCGPSRVRLLKGGPPGLQRDRRRTTRLRLVANLPRSPGSRPAQRGAGAQRAQPCGCSSMVERQPSKLHTGVRFPPPAPSFSCDASAWWGSPSSRGQMLL